jgi:ferric-dicitrate binding protein FerR (iron transport regulator)
MDVKLSNGGDVEQGAANALTEDRRGARSVLGEVAGRAQELSGQAAEKAQQLARRNRKKYRRTARKQSRKLEERLAAAARRLQIDTPFAKRRRRTARRTVLLVAVIGGAIALYLAWRAQQEQFEDGAAEAGPVPDAFGTGVEHAGDGSRSPSDAASV